MEVVLAAARALGQAPGVRHRANGLSNTCFVDWLQGDTGGMESKLFVGNWWPPGSTARAVGGVLEVDAASPRLRLELVSG